MLVPADVPIDLPVTITVVGPRLEVGGARLVRVTADHLDLVGCELGPEPGSRLIVTVDDRTRLMGRVLRSLPEGGLRVSRDGARSADDRASARAWAPVVVRWREASEADVPGWLAGGRDTGAFAVFEGSAQVSVSGMLLPCEGEPPRLGRRLLMRIGAGEGAGPGSPLARPVRVVGCVRRLEPAAAGVEFVEVGDHEAERLAAFVLDELRRGAREP